MAPINKNPIYASIFLPAPAGSVMGIGLFSVFYPKKLLSHQPCQGIAAHLVVAHPTMHCQS
jgi:hypothetical protein